MFLPEGKGGIAIDSTQMLMEERPVIGTGEWDNLQCQYFKGERNGLAIGDIIMVREGNKPLALCKISSDYFQDDNLTNKYFNNWFRYVEVLEWADPNAHNHLFSQGTLKVLYKHSNTRSWHYINDWYKNILQKEDMKKYIDLLLEKKQIILQGAPGTGKTYTAKKIAHQLLMRDNNSGKPDIIQDEDITSLLHNGQNIPSSMKRTIYTIKSINESKILLQGENTEERSINFNAIKKAYENKLWEPGKQKNGLDPYTASLAKYIYNTISNPNSSEEYIKLVQFHPSYTYEDFVRGIEVKLENGQPEYIPKNKVLGEFAKKAYKNWDLYNLDKENKAKDIIEKESKFEQFIDSIQQKIDETGKYKLTENIYLFEYDDIRFKYKGDNWEAHFSGLNMKYSELKKVLDTGLTERAKIKKISNIERLTVSHSTYYTKMAKDYAHFSPTEDKKIEDIKLQNYVLIIDEINRANLPAVLGELIYALEYRGEKVESMYAVDGDNELILPKNLYVIGTMNTADRSVGQIDYAIRRRFAFVNMLPKVLTDEPSFDIALFKKVSAFFIENVEDYSKEPENTILKKSEWLSDEFSPEDVWIGHSYFIMRDKNRENILEYEIKPILREYLKDGILRESINGINIKEIINDL